MLKDMWRASSLPARFFERLEGQPPNILMGFMVGMMAYWLAWLVLALAFLFATDSNALLPIASFFSLAASLHYLFLWGLGGVVVQRPGELDVRAWEVTGWSWTPSLFVALSFLPPLILALLFRLPALIWFLMGAGVLVAFSWHARVLYTALSAFHLKHPRRVFVIYLLLLHAFPLSLMSFLFSVLT